MQTLGDMGEDAVVARVLKVLNQKDSVVVGPGDDCAVVDIGKAETYMLLKTDCLVQGIHYESDSSDPFRVGWKAIARVISDFSAMGGIADHLLVTIAMPPDTSIGYVENLYDGMQKCASLFDTDICGGETSSVPIGSAAVISIAGTGSVEKRRLVSRSGGKSGDVIFVTGTLGGSIQGKHLDFTPRVAEARWLTENFKIGAMMDLSDGVARDLPRLAEASQCGYRIDPDMIPVNDGCDLHQALSDGEDYELLFAVDSQIADVVVKAWPKIFSATPLTKIGELCDPGGGDRFEEDGWQHFNS